MTFMSSPIVVQLTPPGRGAIAVVAVDGPGAVEMLDGLFHAHSGKPLVRAADDRPMAGVFGTEPGEEVVVRRRSGDAVEVHCHGGLAAVERVCDALVGRGCREIGWREWVAERHDDSITAAARLALADARTERTAAILLDQYHGALRRAIGRAGEAIDQGDTAAALSLTRALVARGRLGRHLVDPWRVVVAGHPNVGKSSLVNALVGYARAIVHPSGGTTRDLVAVETAVEGWPVQLIDTAGLREVDDAVERAGVARARQTATDAELVLVVFDQSRPWGEDESRLWRTHGDALVVHNKSDLASAAGPQRPPGMMTSALRGDGIEPLLAVIAQRLVPDAPRAGDAVPFDPAQMVRLEQATEALSHGDLATARATLAGI